MTIKPIKDLQEHKSIVAKSCSDYKDCYALDVKKWAEMFYKDQTKSYIYEPVMPNKPSGR